MQDPKNDTSGPDVETGAGGPDAQPEELARVPRERIEDVDVREQLRRGGEPFERIMAAASGLPAGGVLRVRAIFEPAPLYAVLGSRGFHHWTEQLGPEDWRVWFWHREGDRAPRPGAAATREMEGRGSVESRAPKQAYKSETGIQKKRVVMTAEHGPYLLDVRKLDGPEKHPTIHRKFDALGPGQALTIVNDHEPKPLYYELQAERAGRFDAESYRAYQADQRVWVAVLPTRTDRASGGKGG